MKVIRGVLAFFVSALLFISIFLLSVTIVFNEVVVNNLLPDIIREVLIKNVNENLNQTESESVRNKLTTLTELKGFDELIDTGITEIIECKRDNRDVSDEAVNKFIGFIKDNKEVYQTIFEVKLSDEQIESKEFKDSIKSYFSDEIRKMNLPIDNTTASIITSYKILLSKKYQVYLIILTVVLIILLILLRWSWYKWFKDVGAPLFFSGINLGLSCIFFRYIEQFIHDRFNITLSIMSNRLVTITIIEFALGVIFIIAYNIIKNYKKDLE